MRDLTGMAIAIAIGMALLNYSLQLDLEKQRAELDKLCKEATLLNYNIQSCDNGLTEK